MWDYTVLPAPAAGVTFLLLSQPKVVLDLTTPEECQAELT